MTPNTDLTGRVAVVTGAARGVGLALALQAANRGMIVALFDEDEPAQPHEFW
jgi:NAD(P)-dependent dehydrogenase (short-subunit alcohol dehydrogenase family)